MNEEKVNHILKIDIPNWQNSSADNFNVKLLSLIAKADNTNKAHIKYAWPEVFEAYERWYYGKYNV